METKRYTVDWMRDTFKETPDGDYAIVAYRDIADRDAYIKELQACLNHMTNLWMKEKEKANS